MKAWLRTAAVVLAGLLAACATQPQKPPGPAHPEPPTKGFPGAPDVRDTVYLPVERGRPAPPGYGLYTVVLTRSANRNAARVLAEVLSSTVDAREAAMARQNLNLLTIPVRSAGEAGAVLATVRAQPDAAAALLLQRHYDFGQAVAMLAAVCRPERGAAVMRACGSSTPEGPILLTSQRPLDGPPAPGQRLLVVNLGRTAPAAVAEVVEAYRRQVQRPAFDDGKETDGWRIAALNLALDAASLLPGISKAVAAGSP